MEVAYRGGRPEDPAVVEYDADVLSSPSGLLTVAWLWPDQTFASNVDPFELAAASTPEDWRARLGAQVEHAMRQTSRGLAAYGVDAVDEIRDYLMWQAELSEGDLRRLAEGRVDQLAVWVRICRWLHLEFDNGWHIADPARLARRIEQARMASRIARRLRDIPASKLRDTWTRLPIDLPDAVPPTPREVYHAPKGRYRSLYQALAEDQRKSPTYAISEINEILTHQGESPLPPSATSDPSWWAGRGTKVAGRPQVAAWWAAGYRIAESYGSLRIHRDNLILETVYEDEGREMQADERERLRAITGVTFEALPGRALWLKNADRVEQGEYRMPGDFSVSVPPRDAPPLLSDYVSRALFALDRPTDVIDWVPVPEQEPDTDGPRHVDEHDEDAALTTLINLIEAAGEMNREEIVRSLAKADEEPSVEKPTAIASSREGVSREAKTLLTKARRRGLIINRGTNRKPRWVTTGSCADLVLEIGQVLNERRSRHDQGAIQVPRVGADDTVPAGFLAQVATDLGVVMPADALDVQLARAIVELAGGEWREDMFGTPEGELTRDGLKALSAAVVDSARDGAS